MVLGNLVEKEKSIMNRTAKLFQIVWIRGDQRGVTAILFAIVLTALLSIAALAVDIGYVMTSKNELQNIADAAALAAGRQLGAIYQTMTYDEQQVYVADPTPLINTAIEVAQKNQATVTIQASDVKVGVWDGTTKTFTETLAQPDAVRVRASREGANAVTTFFAKVFAKDSVDVSADATAALTGQSTTDPGELGLPVGISSYFFLPGNRCNDWIVFSPTNHPDSCAGWTSFDYNSNDATLRNIINEVPGFESPATTAGDTIFNFIGGELSNPTFYAMLSLFQRNGYDIDAGGNPITNGNGEPMVDATGTGSEVPLFDADSGERLLYPDGTPRNAHNWPTGVVVYERNDCSNPNQSILIVGYSTVLMTDVLSAPEKLIRGKILCDYVDPQESRGGGGEFGVKGSIPGLVE